LVIPFQDLPRASRFAATDLTAPTRADLSGAVRRAVALVEQELEDMPNMLTMRELAEASDEDGPDAPVITVVDQNDKAVRACVRWHAILRTRRRFFPMLGGWEVWQLIDLSGDTHPIHLHLEPFHVLGRRPITVTVPDNGIGDRSTTATVRLARDPDDELDHAVDANEGGLRTPSGSTPTRSSSSPSASAPTAAATCTTATSSNTRTAT
jgi:spore coat protein A